MSRGSGRSSGPFRQPLRRRLPEANTFADAPVQRRQPAYLLDAKRRTMVIRAAQEICWYLHWTLLAMHVCRNQLHAVVNADQSAQHLMNFQIGR